MKGVEVASWKVALCSRVIGMFRVHLEGGFEMFDMRIVRDSVAVTKISRSAEDDDIRVFGSP